MSILDLQAMEAPQGGSQDCGHGSSASGHSCPSTLSVTLCNGTSGLSVLICH
ncbi:MAG TPA: SapB/AmfS family lanthipeptide [Pseudonocardiaceae bacterium]